MRKLTEEHKRKVSLNNARHWEGKKLSDEHKQNIFEGSRDKNFSENHKGKISKAQQGRQFDEEHKRKLTAAKLKAGKRTTSVKINGKCYDSMIGASRELNMNYSTLMTRIKNPRFTEWIKLSK